MHGVSHSSSKCKEPMERPESRVINQLSVTGHDPMDWAVLVRFPLLYDTVVGHVAFWIFCLFVGSGIVAELAAQVAGEIYVNPS